MSRATAVQALIDQIQKVADLGERHAPFSYEQGICVGYAQCADLLAALLLREGQTCGACGTKESADGDWYTVCGSCRWGLREGQEPQDMLERCSEHPDATHELICSICQMQHAELFEAARLPDDVRCVNCGHVGRVVDTGRR